MTRGFRIWWFRFTHRWREFWARKYTGQGKREIDRLPEDDLVYRVFDYIFQKRMTFNRELCDYDCSALNPSEAAVWYCVDVDTEIRNGGFNQYFFNKHTRPVEPVLRAYALVGAHRHAELFARAAHEQALVADAHERARYAGQKDVGELLAAFSASYADNPLNDLDHAYYELTPKIDDILAAYIRSHPDEFVAQPIARPKR